MTTNYATNFAPVAEEAFALASLTQVFSGKFDWVGAKTVKVFSNETVALTDYNSDTGYGSATRIGNTVDELTLAGDKGFSGRIDRLDMNSTAGTLRAAEWLGLQTRQQVIPAIDGYRFNALYTACPTGQVSEATEITSANAYSEFLAGNETLDEDKVPTVGRVCFASPAFINKLKLDDNFIKASELGQTILLNGQVGEVDGVPIIKVPSSILNATDNHLDFIIVHVDAVAAPMKLEDTQIYETVPGWSGSQIDGRFVFDLFLVDAKSAAIYCHKHA